MLDQLHYTPEADLTNGSGGGTPITKRILDVLKEAWYSQKVYSRSFRSVSSCVVLELVPLAGAEKNFNPSLY